MNPGIHLLHKPVGPTSFSVVKACIEWEKASPPQRRHKICHGGALDPFAHGLLLILVEPATRVFDYLHDIPKVYEATVRWGTETDNGDLHGRVTLSGDPSNLTPRRLDDAVATFIGWHDQTPPATSNKRVDGERAYVKAHRGETVVLPTSRVYLHEAGWIEHNLPHQSRLLLTARGGYYVRALARDLGRMLGCGAHLTALHRTAVGPWRDPGPEHHVEISGRDLLPWLPTRLLSDQEIGELRNEQLIPNGDLLAPDWGPPQSFPAPQPMVRGFHLNRFIVLLAPRDGRLQVATWLPGGV
jgi:tRNA pseudouridine55 synthase